MLLLQYHGHSRNVMTSTCIKININMYMYTHTHELYYSITIYSAVTQSRTVHGVLDGYCVSQLNMHTKGLTTTVL